MTSGIVTALMHFDLSRASTDRASTDQDKSCLCVFEQRLKYSGTKSAIGDCLKQEAYLCTISQTNLIQDNGTHFK